MIDNIGGVDRVNNFLTTLNLKPISVDKLKKMERRAGAHIETVAERSMSKSAAEAFSMEMSDVAAEESQMAQKSMDMIDEEMGVGLLQILHLWQGIALETQPDVTELPVAVPHGSFKPVAIDSQQQPTFIMFDLETTDLIRGNMMPHITQVAAVEPQFNARFNIYVKPKVPVSSEAQRITGIVVSDSGNMSVHGEAVQFISITAAVNAFNAWVSRFQNVVLVAHYGRRFDFPVYVSMLESIGALEVFCDKVIGFIDSRGVFKKVFPNEKSYKQEELIRKFLQTSYSAHDAMEDVISLGHLILHSNCSSEFLLKHSFSPKAVYNQRLFNREKYKHIDSLSPLVVAGVMKRPTAENIAGSGLNLNHLRVIFQRDGEDGLHNSFTVKNSEGLPRVTNTKRVLEDVIPKLAVFFTNDQT